MELFPYNVVDEQCVVDDFAFLVFTLYLGLPRALWLKLVVSANELGSLVLFLDTIAVRQSCEASRFLCPVDAGFACHSPSSMVPVRFS